ncbi:hypothetical protein BD770DRAFT_477363 [Pilaira anomala]|nr:hypothetical protein BD770DRAFT_477363 [Pilaira anomala]
MSKIMQPTGAKLKAVFARTTKKDTKKHKLMVSGNNNVANKNCSSSSSSSSSSSTTPPSKVSAKRNAAESEAEEDASTPATRRKKEEANVKIIWKDWVMFLKDENTQKITTSSDTHLEAHKEAYYPLPPEYLGYASSVIESNSKENFKSAFKKTPNNSSIIEFLEDIFRSSYDIYTTHKDLEDYENTFNDMLVYPFIKAAEKAVDSTVSDLGAEFGPGEVDPLAMKQQLRNIPVYNDCKNQYKADDVVALYGIDKLEALLPETSSHFGNDDQHKISFDHHKGLFGAVTIADKFPLADMNLFEKKNSRLSEEEASPFFSL